MAKKIKIDVTDLIGKIKERRIPFYPVMMYVLLKSLNAAEGEIFFEQEKELFLKNVLYQKGTNQEFLFPNKLSFHPFIWD